MSEQRRAPARPVLDVEGVLVVDKPTGMTSHDVVGRIRHLVGAKVARRGRSVGPKVGHAGTLDPDATGVLVVCLGRATKLVPYLQASRKTYDAKMRLGRTTTTLDDEGEQTSLQDASAITEPELCETLKGYVGDIEQIPPMVSAVKVGGERLHVKARRGEVVERKPRPVTIHDIVLADFEPGEAAYASFLVTCSAGTYIRTLAADVGADLGVGAHLVGLRRLGSGRFSVEDAVSIDKLDAIANDGRLPEVLMTMADAMADHPTVQWDEASVKAIRNGQHVDATGLDGPVAVLDPAGELVAVVQDQKGRARSSVVFT